MQLAPMTKLIMASAAAGSLLAVGKYIAAARTGSAAMLCEAVHSLIYATSQGLLVYGLHRNCPSFGVRVSEASTDGARRARTRQHAEPNGDLIFWTYVAATLLYSLGAGIAINEGVAKLTAANVLIPNSLTIAGLLAGSALGAAACLAARRLSATPSHDNAITTGAAPIPDQSRHPARVTVLIENGAAIAGNATAAAAITASHLASWIQADALAAIGIGMLMGLVAALMAIETKTALLVMARHTISPSASTHIATSADVTVRHDRAGQPAASSSAMREPRGGPADDRTALTVIHADAAPLPLPDPAKPGPEATDDGIPANTPRDPSAAHELAAPAADQPIATRLARDEPRNRNYPTSKKGKNKRRR